MSERNHPQLDLSSVFAALEGCVYCVIKPDADLPDYRDGGDVDLFCLEPDLVARAVIGALRPQLGGAGSFKVERQGTHSHLDVLTADGALIFRFDLYGALPPYRNVLLKSGLFDAVLEGRRPAEVGADSRKCVIQVPADIDDMLLRYVEYQEWYAQRPDKIKHIDHLMSGDEELRQQMLAKLHYYTALPRPATQQQASVSSGELCRQCLAVLVRKSLRLARRLVSMLVVRIRKYTGIFR
jgi:hypothetical protein